MQLDLKPVHRKVIVPWYDSDVVCIATLMLAGFVLLIGVCGIHVAYETAESRQYLWIPGLVFALGLAVFLSVSVRLIYRYVQRWDR